MRLRGRFFLRISTLLLVVLCVSIGSRLGLAQDDRRTSAPAMPTDIVSHNEDVNPSPAAYPTIEDSAGYIVPKAPILATIFHAVEEHHSLSAGDHIVIDAGADQDLQIGDWFTVIRKSRTFDHPVTNRPVGTLVATLGYAIATRVQPSATVLRLMKTFDSVELGDQVTRFMSPQPEVASTAFSPTTRTIRGYITAAKDAKVSVGEGDIVYLDQGEAEGVRVGDRFNVFREGSLVRHPITRRMIRLPRQTFGEVAVLDIRDHTATALVTSSLRELSAGAPVELQAPPIQVAATQPDDTARDDDRAQLEARLAQVLPCLEVARQAIRAAEAADAPEVQLALARSALTSAEQRLEQAKAALARNDVEQARSHLEAAQADCLTAQELSQFVGTADRPAVATEHYTVKRGDTLWGISALPEIYQNPLMWPMIYRANRDQINDPDLIYPKQMFAIPRNYSQEEANTAIQRARKRGPWRLGDGPDVYILEGVRP